MSKYCNRCKRYLEINNFYSYKKSIFKQCVNKKINCDHCNKEVNSTNLSKHKKQIHSTFLRSDKSDSTYNSKHNRTHNSTYDDSTLQRSNKSDSTLQRSDKSDSTLLRSDKSDSTLQRYDKSDSTLQRYDKSDSTLQVSDKNNEPLYPTIEDGLYPNKYNELKKDKIFDIKTRNQINRILTKNRMLHNKIKNDTITKRKEEQFENNLNKLRDLDYFDERVCKILLKYKYLD